MSQVSLNLMNIAEKSVSLSVRFMRDIHDWQEGER
jgi:hypothetical protein